MSQRINYAELSPKLAQKLMELSQLAGKESIDGNLRNLVQIRASQLNGCAFCLDMHVKEAKIEGERELRLYHLSIWRESPLFTAKERAALEWTESLTKIGEHGVSDELFARVREHLSEKEISDLTFIVGIINTWNRLGVGFQAVPGSRDEMFGLTKAGLK